MFFRMFDTSLPTSVTGCKEPCLHLQGIVGSNVNISLLFDASSNLVVNNSSKSFLILLNNGPYSFLSSTDIFLISDM